MHYIFYSRQQIHQAAVSQIMTQTLVHSLKISVSELTLKMTIFNSVFSLITNLPSLDIACLLCILINFAMI